MFFVIFFLILSCTRLKEKSLIIYNSELNFRECGSGFFVPDRIEKDTFFKQELEKYLYKGLIDDEVCDIISEEVFLRPSFVNMVMEIYLDTNFVKYSIYEYESEWIYTYKDLIYYCSNEKIKYQLCDSLLVNGFEDGIIHFWEGGVENLTEVPALIEFYKDNIDILSEVATVYHNSQMIIERDDVMKSIEKISEDRSNLLLRLFQGKKIDYIDFMEEIYGGM